MPLKSSLPDVHVINRPYHELLLDACRKWGNDVAVINGVTKQSFTYNDIVYMTDAVATFIHDRGLAKGDRVILSMTNCPEYIPIFLGLLSRGVIPVALNPAYTHHELAHYFTDSGSIMVITQNNIKDNFVNAMGNMNHKHHVKEMIVLDLPSNEPSSVDNVKLTSLASVFSHPVHDIPHVPIYTRTDIAYMPYSSGTTGLPKGVMVSHYNLCDVYGTSLCRAFFIWPTRGDCCLSFLPYYHVYGGWLWQFQILEGVKFVTIPSFDPPLFLQLIQDYKVRILHVVPPILLFLAKHPLVDKYDISSVQVVLVGAAPTGKDISMALVKRHKDIRYMLQGYGMTEDGITHMSPAVPIEKVAHGSCGILMPNKEIKIVNPETGVELEGPNKTGELCIKTQSAMLGYWNRPKQTAEMIDKDGWLHTGDIGYYDEEENFYVVDRLKELIKVKGFQVAPAELEDLLHKHVHVADCAVIGVPNERTGETPVAFVVVNKGDKTTEQDIIHFVEGQVAEFKRISRIIFVDEIPKSPSGKILRRLLRDRVKNEKPKL